VARIGAGLADRRPLLEIGAGRERLAFAGEHDGADVGPVAQRVEDGDDLLAETAVLRVHRRPRQPHGRDVIGNRQLEALVGVGHRDAPVWLD
jgi:hypothetical protein